MRLLSLITYMLYYEPHEQPDAPGSEVRAIGPDRCTNTLIHDLWSQSDGYVRQYPVWTYTSYARKLSRALDDARLCAGESPLGSPG